MSNATLGEPLVGQRARLRVTLCITELDPGGAERQFVRLATGLDRTRFDVDVVCLSKPGPLVQPLREQGIPVTCLNARGRFDIAVVARLWQHLRKTSPDLLQTFLFHANIAGRIAARLARVPVVVSGIRVAERKQRWHLRLDRYTQRLVDRYVCVSQDVARFSREVAGLSPEKLLVIPNCVDESFFSVAPPADLAEFGFPHDAKVVLFVGRLDEQKNPLLAIDAFQIVAERDPSLRLLIVGTGPLEAELRSRASSLRAKVAFAGFRDDVASLMKASNCLLLTSLWEGMPNVLLEAVAIGLPVVASPVEGVREALDGDRMSIVVPALTSTAFADALERVLRCGRTRSAKGQESQREVIKQVVPFSPPEAYGRLYEDLLSRGVLGNLEHAPTVASGSL